MVYDPQVDCNLLLYVPVSLLIIHSPLYPTYNVVCGHVVDTGCGYVEGRE